MSVGGKPSFSTSISDRNPMHCSSCDAKTKFSRMRKVPEPSLVLWFQHVKILQTFNKRTAPSAVIILLGHRISSAAGSEVRRRDRETQWRRQVQSRAPVCSERLEGATGRSCSARTFRAGGRHNAPVPPALSIRHSPDFSSKLLTPGCWAVLLPHLSPTRSLFSSQQSDSSTCPNHVTEFL